MKNSRTIGDKNPFFIYLTFFFGIMKYVSDNFLCETKWESHWFCILSKKVYIETAVHIVLVESQTFVGPILFRGTHLKHQTFLRPEIDSNLDQEKRRREIQIRNQGYRFKSQTKDIGPNHTKKWLLLVISQGRKKKSSFE